VALKLLLKTQGDRLAQSRLARIVLVFKKDLDKSDIGKHSYAMAYVTLFSLVPSLAAVFALVSLFVPMFGDNWGLIVEAKRFILKHLATGSGEQAIHYLESFLANTDFKKIGMTGFAGILVSLILLLRQVEVALNRIFEIDQPRPLFIRFVYFWTFITLGTFSLALSIGSLSSMSWAERTLEASTSLRILTDTLYAISIFIFFFLLYKVVPNRFIARRHAALGGLVAAILLAQAIRFFSLYVQHFTSYEAVYGALSAMPIFMFWLYVIWYITLFGALIVKRSMDGFLPEETNHDEEPKLTLSESYIQTLLPFLTLVKVYQSYDRDQGRGARADAIARELCLPLSAVRRAFHLLESRELVVASQTPELASIGENTYFPRQPSQYLTFARLKEVLLGDEHKWLEESHLPQESTEAYQRLIQAYLSGTNACIERDLRTLHSFHV
jgi:membrane protein